MMGYAKLVNENLEFAPYFLEKNGASILGYNFDSNIDMMVADGYKPVETIEDKSSYIDYDGTFSFEFEEEADKIVEKAIFHKYSDEEKSQQVRDTRNAYLEGTDKMIALPDFPISKEEKENLITYRQYLRDIPETKGFPWIKVLNFEEWSKKNVAN